MIKKLAALTLALLMTLSLAACGSQKDDQAGGAVTPGVTDDAVPDMGTVSGGTYTNRFAGISCTLDDSWYFYTDEQIDELNGFVRESTSDEELKTRLESSSSAAAQPHTAAQGIRRAVRCTAGSRCFMARPSFFRYCKRLKARFPSGNGKGL